MIRKNAVESVRAERNILISVRNPFVVNPFIFLLNLPTLMNFWFSTPLHGHLMPESCFGLM